MKLAWLFNTSKVRTWEDLPVFVFMLEDVLADGVDGVDGVDVSQNLFVDLGSFVYSDSQNKKLNIFLSC